MKYFLAHNEIDVFHYGQISEEQSVTTGQPILKFFDTSEELNLELSIYGREIEGYHEAIYDLPQDSFPDSPLMDPYDL